KIIETGRGNWDKGPRIIRFSMRKGVCNCDVDKLYYSTEVANEFKVTERIKCEDTENEIQIEGLKDGIEGIAVQIDKLKENKLLTKYFYPNMSGCGGAVYGFYVDSILKMIESRYSA